MTDSQQLGMNLPDTQPVERVDEFKFEPIKGYPMLNWRGKRPFTSTKYYPAQLKEVHGEEVNGWLNKIYWGDNLQVMSHLLKKYRGRVKLAYIDPPFDSKADYRLKVEIRGNPTSSNSSAFEEKQYADIWSNDDYLQFMYERLILIKELLAEEGSIWLHCDWHRSHHLRIVLDEVFGANNFRNEVIWQRTDPHNDAKSRLGWIHDTIFWYAKAKEKAVYNWSSVTTPLGNAALKEYSLVELPDGQIERYSEKEKLKGRRFKLDDCTYKGNDSSRRFDWRGAKPSSKRVWPYKSATEMDAAVKRGEFYLRNQDKGAARCRVSFLDERDGQLLQTIWTDTGRMKGGVRYPTEKPPSLLERIIKASSNRGDLIFDCFMGSGTTQAVAMQQDRRFIGADINISSIQLTTRRLLKLIENSETSSNQTSLLSNTQNASDINAGFEVYNVNHYDVFRNPIQAKDVLVEALAINPLSQGSLFSGEKDGRMWKIMPVNRIATKADLSPLINGFDYKAFEKRQQENPKIPVEKITLVCMGHDPDLKAALQAEVKPYEIDVEVVDILRDRQDLQFKRDSEAEAGIEKGELVIQQFYPMNLLSKLSLQQENVEDWREMVESVMVDWNYDGAVLEPKTVDIPDKNELVQGRYLVPEGAGTIRIKITDLLSESLEMEVQRG